ncbi:MAG: ABC-F family ATP-binding cassette domain-containing protein, partial [Saprospiraceae bacterium]
YLALRAERKEKMESAFKNQQRVIAEKEKIINKFMAKATKTKMAQSMKKQLDKMERVEIPQENTAAMYLKFPPAPRSGEVVVDATDVVKNYGDIGVLEGVDFSLERGERVAFVGQNGQGKTTLSKILIGIENASGGKIELGHNTKIGYYAQNQAEELDATGTLLQVLESKASEDMRPKARSILGAFQFSGDDVEKKVSVLSGGERARLALACMLLEPFNLLVLDEPTNHLDIISKEVLKDAILRYDGSLIVVSHDRDFLKGLTQKTIEFRDKKLYEYLGDVEYFLEKRKLQDMREAEKREKIKKAEKAELSAEDKKRIHDQKRILQKSVQKVEKKIADTEKKIKNLEVKMGATDFYSSPDMGKVMDEHKTLKSKVEKLEEEW